MLPSYINDSVERVLERGIHASLSDALYPFFAERVSIVRRYKLSFGSPWTLVWEYLGEHDNWRCNGRKTIFSYYSLERPGYHSPNARAALHWFNNSCESFTFSQFFITNFNRSTSSSACSLLPSRTSCRIRSGDWIAHRTCSASEFVAWLSSMGFSDTDSSAIRCIEGRKLDWFGSNGSRCVLIYYQA